MGSAHLAYSGPRSEVRLISKDKTVPHEAPKGWKWYFDGETDLLHLLPEYVRVDSDAHRTAFMKRTNVDGKPAWVEYTGHRIKATVFGLHVRAASESCLKQHKKLMKKLERVAKIEAGISYWQEEGK